MFIRTKQIKGKDYAYLVENKWKKGRSKQIVKKYLGRVYVVDDKEKPEIPEDTKADKILKILLEKEVGEVAKVDWSRKKIVVNGRKAVLKLNGGFLCDYTFREILRAVHERNEEKPGARLASAFASAGIRISQDDFVKLYRSYH